MADASVCHYSGLPPPPHPKIPSAATGGCQTNSPAFPLFQIMAGAEEAKFTGMAKYFNSYTMTGRANVSTCRHHGHARLNRNAPLSPICPILRSPTRAMFLFPVDSRATHRYRDCIAERTALMCISDIHGSECFVRTKD